MLFAERHRKLGRDHSRAHERAEDLLTSSAFQLLRYVPVEVGLAAVLGRVRRVRWADGTVRVEPERPLWLVFPGATRFEPVFWPRWSGAGEPDVVISLYRDGVVVAKFVVEVKLDSPKSPRDDTEPDETADDPGEERRPPDQLWDYFNHLNRGGIL